MFRRMFPPLLLLLLVWLGLVALLIARHVADDALRGELLSGLLALTLAAGVAGLLLSMWVSRGLARQLDEIRDAARHLALGQGRPRVHVEDGGEVGSLGQTFNDLGERLAARIA